MPGRGQYDRDAARERREASVETGDQRDPTLAAPPAEVNSRAEEVREVRRKQPGLAAYSGINLTVDETRLDRKTYQYRFVSDMNGRVGQLHALDWDPAPEAAKPDTNSLGTLASAHGGLDDGRPYNTLLMRKRKDWFDTDQKEKQRPLDDAEDQIRRGNPNHPANRDLRGSGVYTPDTGNTIERLT